MRWFMVAFGALFLLAGLGIGIGLTGGAVLDAIAMRGWVPVDGTLLEAGIEGEGGEAREAKARYSYMREGETFEGMRVGVHGTADNIGDWHERTHARLQRALAEGGAVVVWIDPDDPREAVLDPHIRWGLVAFELGFGIVFGAAGGTVVVFGLREGRRGRPRPATASLRQGDTGTAWTAAAIAGFFLALLAIVLLAEREPSFLLWFFFLAALAATALALWAALRRSIAAAVFRAATFRPDPDPAGVGGTLGGVLELPLPHEPNRQLRLHLQCRIVEQTGHRWRTRVNWESEGYATTEPGPLGSRARFRFEVPSGQPESSTASNRSVAWRLDAGMELPGIDFERSFPVTVARHGGKPSAALPAVVPIVGRTESEGRLAATAVPDGFWLVQRGARVSRRSWVQIAAGIVLAWPGLALLGDGFGGTLFGLVLAAVGLGLLGRAAWQHGHARRVRAFGLGVELWHSLFGYPASYRRYPAERIAAVEAVAHTARLRRGKAGTKGAADAYELRLRLSGGGTVRLADGIADRQFAAGLARQAERALGRPGDS